MKRLLHFKALIAFMCLMCSLSAGAYDFYVNGIYYNQYTLSSVEVTYKNTSYGTYSGSVSIPSSITVSGKTYAVIRIGEKAFYQCRSLTSVSLPSGISTIGGYAFSYCTSLTSINLPSTLREIETDAFANCESLTSITIPNSVTELSLCTFCDCI